MTDTVFVVASAQSDNYVALTKELTANVAAALAPYADTHVPVEHSTSVCSDGADSDGVAWRTAVTTVILRLKHR